MRFKDQENALQYAWAFAAVNIPGSCRVINAHAYLKTPFTNILDQSNSSLTTGCANRRLKFFLFNSIHSNSSLSWDTFILHCDRTLASSTLALIKSNIIFSISSIAKGRILFICFPIILVFNYFINLSCIIFSCFNNCSKGAANLCEMI